MNGLMHELGPLAAYGEYTDEINLRTAKKVFVPENHLGSELSPYLLQHANNPVGWYSWGQEAFETARREDKPVFLSIGYSSCHWCHIMERECFNDVEVAGMINDTCIAVKVDREEHPDIDNLFMEVCRIQNGSAGWPLNIFLTPEGRPFFCTTWLPKRTRGQMPGITEILPRIKWLWLMQREDVERSANDLYELVKEKFSVLSGSKYISSGRIHKFTAFEALESMRKVFDLRWGGFGSAPKFPEANKLLFLLSQANEESGASKRDKSDALTMTDITLRRMWRGGIHDHLGGGFSRYAVDERWLVPHFEKLLCDQAMILLAAALSQEMNQSSFNRLIAEDIIFCVTKYFCDNGSYSQGFRSAIDADTPEGEGRYYLWTENEIKSILPEGDAGLFCAAYAVLPSGNFGSELAGSQMGWNILYEASTVTELAKRYGIKGVEVGRRLYECRKLLLEARDKRSDLISDNKILMNWNGLMIGALARASSAFEQSEWKDIAERAALFLVKSLPDKNGNWRRRWIAGKVDINAIAEDYAYFLWGIIELYKASKKFGAGDKQLNDWIKTAQGLADTMIQKFFDEKSGGLFMNSGEDNNIFIRMKTAEDMNSLPSANALAALALDELAFILEDKKYSDYARRIIECFSHAAADNPLNYISLINTALMWKPFKPKKKIEPESKRALTDEELNQQESGNFDSGHESEGSDSESERRSARASRRAARSERAGSSSGSDRAERVERRRSGAHNRRTSSR